MNTPTSEIDQLKARIKLLESQLNPEPPETICYKFIIVYEAPYGANSMHGICAELQARGFKASMALTATEPCVLYVKAADKKIS